MIRYNLSSATGARNNGPELRASSRKSMTKKRIASRLVSQKLEERMVKDGLTTTFDCAMIRTLPKNGEQQNLEN